MSYSNLGGHCYCGAVKFEASGKPIWVGHCHCESCRRASGSVMTSSATYRLDKVVFTGTMPTRFPTNDGVVRSFCGQCGSPVAYESTEQENQIDLHLGLFDDLEQIKPQNHTFDAEKASWLQADEHLPRIRGRPNKLRPIGSLCAVLKSMVLVYKSQLSTF
ncbi:MAG: GFA family protein [Proteobacteria bacterium]|nr:GFA family protein [Pseudomonadota bacterium]